MALSCAKRIQAAAASGKLTAADNSQPTLTARFTSSIAAKANPDVRSRQAKPASVIAMPTIGSAYEADRPIRAKIELGSGPTTGALATAVAICPSTSATGEAAPSTNAIAAATRSAGRSPAAALLGAWPVNHKPAATTIANSENACNS